MLIFNMLNMFDFTFHNLKVNLMGKLPIGKLIRRGNNRWGCNHKLLYLISIITLFSN